MHILLTGATGFIGSHLAAELLARGHRVSAAGRRPGYDQRLGHVPADMAQDTEKASWLARLSGVDVVINTVGIFAESGRQTFAALHSAAPRALFAACAEAGVKLVIQVSALGADQDATTAYHLSKREADDYLASLPLRSVIVQPSLVYGADGASSRLFRTLATLPVVFRFGPAAQQVQPIHVDDVVAAIAALAEDDVPARQPRGQRLPLVGPVPLDFTAYLATLRRAMGLGRWMVLPLPAGLARLAARLATHIPGSPLSPDALAMLERGNTADGRAAAQLLRRPLRAPQEFISAPHAERRLAQLGWLLPLLRLSIAVVWIWTAIVSAFVYPVADSVELLLRTGVPLALAPLMLYGASALDLLFGVATLGLARRRRKWLWRAQFALIAFYSVAIALRLPEFLGHPYGPISKNLPMLAAIWLLHEMDKDR